MSLFDIFLGQVSGATPKGGKDPQKLKRAIVESIRTLNTCDALSTSSARERCASHIFGKISSPDRINWKFDNLGNHADINRRMLQILERDIGVDTRTAQEIRNRVFKIMGWKLTF